MKLHILIVVIIIAVIHVECSSKHKEWIKYKAKYHKVYPNARSEAAHKKAFFKKKQEIAKHNARFNIGKETYIRVINKFADYLPANLKSMNGINMKSVKRYLFKSYPADNMWRKLNHFKAPKRFDWRDHNAVTPAKEQGSCNDCWIFSSVAAIEAQVAIHTGKLYNLSEQNIVDCYGADGCKNTGDPQTAFDYVIKNKGIELEKYYPYKANYSHTCSYDPKKQGGKISQQKIIPPGNVELLKKIIAKYGPVVTALDATHLHDYKNGIANMPCSARLNHAVIIVGYGVTAHGHNYWIVKNSWGPDWGEDGFFRITSGINLCSIETYLFIPIY